MSAMAIPSAPQRPSATRLRGEPGKIPSMILAAIVHVAFFSVIVFGVSWQVNRPAPAVAELWDRLPPLDAPPQDVKPEEIKPAPVEKPPEPVIEKADIQQKAKLEALDKKKKQEELKKEDERKQKLAADAEKKRLDEETRKAEAAAKKVADDKARADEAARAALASAVQDYAQRIANLIRNRANIPDSVNGMPTVEVKVRLLVNGVVFDAQLTKPSGNRVYDDAVERAINGIRQWPVPDNASLLSGKRELLLKITHEK